MRLNAFWLAIMAGLISCSGPTKEVVVVYSPHGVEMLKEAEARFEAANPGVDVQWLDMGSQDVYNRINAEKGNPHADVWWGATSSMFIKAAEGNLLEPYRPTWAAAIPADQHDAQDRWYGMFRSPLAIVFNDRQYKPQDVPQTWDDLLKPEWKGKIALRNPLPSGTMRVFIGAMILRAANEDAGIAWLKSFHQATGSYTENPQLLYDRIKRNPEMITVWLMPDAVLQRQLNGYPFGYVIPPDTAVTTDGIAIVKGAPHKAWAEKFYEFVNAPEFLALQAEKFAKMPARTDLDPKSLPEWLVKQEVRPMTIDWGAFAQKEQGWMDRWEREVHTAP